MRACKGLQGLLAIGVCIAGISSAAAQTRVDVNGQFVNPCTTYGFPCAIPPNGLYSWSVYMTGIGGGLASRIDTGGSSNVFCVNRENEEDIPTLGTSYAPYPQGHSLLIGGNTTVGQSGTYGVYQTLSATAGKLYWLFGAQSASTDWSTNQQNKYSLNYGITTGATQGTGMVSSGNIRQSGGTTREGRFMYGMVAPVGATQVTAHVGMITNGANNSDINAYVDGIRVYEFDIPVHTCLNNTGFESAASDLSLYNVMSGSSFFREQRIPPGWLPLGGVAAQLAEYALDPGLKTEGAQSFRFNQYKGNGRCYLIQRVMAGGIGTQYTFSGEVRGDTADSNAMLGIDPTGGVDPAAATVVWSAAAPIGSWGFITLPTQTDVTGNGVTVFLAAGNYSLTQGYRTGGNFGGNFDRLSLVTSATPCDDSNSCTIDACVDDVCIHTPIDCNDSNACTSDSCDSGTGQCINTPISCDDSNPCTLDGCNPTLGCLHVAKNCNDNDACTTDSCDTGTGNCQHTAINCDDNDACTTDSCDSVLGCQHAAVSCDDNDACTTDSCDAQLGCQHEAVDCDDNNPGTLDTCDPQLGCQHTPICAAPTITAAQSVKMHTGVGEFGINMAVPPLSQVDDVECRLINAGNPMRVVVTFSTAVVAVDGTFNAGAGQEIELSSNPAGTITVAGISQPAANKLEIALSAVPNASCLHVKLHDVACDAGGGSPGAVMPDVTLTQRVLLCDAVNAGNGLVESNDVSFTKARASLGTVDATSFRTDYDTDGTVSNVDVSRSKAAASLSQTMVTCP